ncbi:hypothetical protein L083_7785 [Actinoplanes sp. N902-109]|nr:hypothetical protein L083_7785 [Actinoplanes sp. N902-109]
MPGLLGPALRWLRNAVDVATWRCDVRQAEPDSPRRPVPCPGTDGGTAAVTPPSRPVGTHSSRVPRTCLALWGVECKDNGHVPEPVATPRWSRCVNNPGMRVELVIGVTLPGDGPIHRSVLMVRRNDFFARFDPDRSMLTWRCRRLSASSSRVDAACTVRRRLACRRAIGDPARPD